jgi:hypothetical protein
MMKTQRHIKEIKAIGADAWELQHFTGLRGNASRTSQLEALIRDCCWLRDHIEEICRRIELVMREIEGDDPPR